MKTQILKLKMNPVDKLVLLYIIDNTVYGQFNERSAEIGKALSITRNQALQALENLQISGYITTTKDGVARYRSTKITSKTKELIK
jgi:hypothetical protein